MQISANHLKIGYDDKIVVPDFDVVIHKHDITTFIGPNGCGKSTILKALAGKNRHRRSHRRAGKAKKAGQELPCVLSVP